MTHLIRYLHVYYVALVFALATVAQFAWGG